ncbi:MAG: phosphatidate cytidylyltransferase [Promethearchaeota archaeon]
MNIWMGIGALYIFALGILLLWHVTRHWNDIVKKKFRISELFVVALFFFQGIQIFTLFHNSDSESIRWLSFFFCSLLFLEFVILFGGNILPNIIKQRKNPQFRAEYTYYHFLDQMAQTKAKISKKSLLFRDLSRKGLHFIQFLGVVLIYWLSIANYPYRILIGIEPDEFRNFFFFLISALFWIMMMIGDITRMENWRVLPKWAWKWYSVSLDYPRESWTINAATPILLANLIWTNRIFPIQILFITVWISCISDAAAALVGKFFGQYHLNKIGKFPEKTWEGLIAGILTTLIGTGGILYFIPTSFPPLAIIMILGGTVSVFAITDLYCSTLNDNIVNSLASGTVIWLIFLIFA